MTSKESRSDPFSVPLNHLSPPQDAPAPIFKLELATKPLPIASVTLPEQGDSFIIILIPSLDSGFEPVVIPAKDPAFRPGDFYVLNISKKPVLGIVGTTEFRVPRRKSKVVRPDGARENRFYDVTLGVKEEGETQRVISRSRWPVGKQMRTYVFFFDNPVRKDIDFRAIDEFVPVGKNGE